LVIKKKSSQNLCELKQQSEMHSLAQGSDCDSVETALLTADISEDYGVSRLLT